MLPLDGITVVALEQAVAAPFATRQLADLGARVIKVERPGGGDFARGYDTTVRGMSSYFVWLNRGKQSVTLDIKDPTDRRLLDAMLAAADVFVQNLVPGAVQRLGLDEDTLRTRHPRLVTCAISGSIRRPQSCSSPRSPSRCLPARCSVNGSAGAGSLPFWSGSPAC